jgi:hypothetical protein
MLKYAIEGWPKCCGEVMTLITPNRDTQTMDSLMDTKPNRPA